MKFYRGTGCHVILVGLMTEMPILSMDKQGDYVATVNILVQCNHDNAFKDYGVIVFGEPALHLRRYAFPGLYLWIEGDLHTDKTRVADFSYKNIQVVAEKIKFLPNSSEPNGAIIQGEYRL